MAVDTSS